MAELIGIVKSIEGWRDVGWVTVGNEDYFTHKHLCNELDAAGRRIPCRDGTYWSDLREGQRVRVVEVDPSPLGRRCRIVGRAD